MYDSDPGGVPGSASWQLSKTIQVRVPHLGRNLKMCYCAFHLPHGEQVARSLLPPTPSAPLVRGSVDVAGSTSLIAYDHQSQSPANPPSNAFILRRLFPYDVRRVQGSAFLRHHTDIKRSTPMTNACPPPISPFISGHSINLLTSLVIALNGHGNIVSPRRHLLKYALPRSLTMLFPLFILRGVTFEFTPTVVIC